MNHDAFNGIMLENSGVRVYLIYAFNGLFRFSWKTSGTIKEHEWKNGIVYSSE